MKWTEEEIELLKLFYEQGLNTEDIANELDRTGESIRKKASRLKIKHPDRTNNTIFTHEDYVNKLNSINSSMIPLENYINTKTKILHKCLNCNAVYKSSPKIRLRSGCKYCNCGRQTRTHEQYLNELNKLNINLYPTEKYINSYTKIKHKCKDCNKEEYYRPYSRLEGYGCRYCRRTGSGISNTEPCILYLVNLIDFNLFKIGITSKPIKERMYSAGIYNYEIIIQHNYNTGKEALEKEKEWLSNVNSFLVNTGLLKNGNTETFKYES